MSSSPLQQVASSAVDAAGLSISTSTPSSSNARLGTAYDLGTMAAASPIHFHPLTSQSLGGNTYLMVNSTSWSAATQSGSGPGGYSAYTPSATPTWTQVNAATGQTTAVNGSPVIPMTTTNSGYTLKGGASRGSDNLWLLHSANSGAVLQSWFNNQTVNTVQNRGEETLPTATNGSDNITFTSGIHWSATTTPYLYVYGTGSTSGQLYQARKKWSRVGRTATSNTPSDSAWEVFTGDPGWTTSMGEAGPVSGVAGPLTSAGPVSFGHQMIQRAQAGMTGGTTGYTLLATTQNNAGTMTSQIYSSLGGRPWQPTGSPIALGTSGSTYTGGTVQFQSHIGPNPSMINASTSQGAIPYVVTTKASVDGVDSLNTAWSLLQVPTIT